MTREYEVHENVPALMVTELGVGHGIMTSFDEEGVRPEWYLVVQAKGFEVRPGEHHGNTDYPREVTLLLDPSEASGAAVLNMLRELMNALSHQTKGECPDHAKGDFYHDN